MKTTGDSQVTHPGIIPGITPEVVTTLGAIPATRIILAHPHRALLELPGRPVAIRGPGAE